MDLKESKEERSFRLGFRRWVERSIPSSLRNAEAFSERLQADRLLAAGGYLGYTWPQEFGGGGGSAVLAGILDEERARAGIPAARSPSRFGISLLAPALIRHGNAHQQQRFLRPILRAEEIWCQGFSEPEAGSDLANVQARLVDSGDDFVLSGNKTWTTQAHEADWCFALVRSRGTPRHRNLTLVLVDMHQSGIDVRPLRQMTGGAEFNEVFFDDVRVDADHVVGGLHNGWKVAMTVLGAERSYGQLSRYMAYSQEFARIAQMVAQSSSSCSGRQLEELGTIRADLTGIRNLSLRIISLANAGEDLGVLPSITKLWWSTTHQRMVELGFDISVEVGSDSDWWFTQALEARAETIYAGSSEIQKNIISERLLDMPR